MIQVRPVHGYEGRYFVSSEGEIISYANRQRRAHVLKPSKDSYGYHIVTLVDCGGRRSTETIHRIVAVAFLGLRDGMQVNHKDGLKWHNSVSNLEWVTASQNQSHAVATGLRPVGSKSPSAKLTNGQVRQIRGLLKTRTMKSIAKSFGVSATAIHHIASGRTWKQVA